MESFPEPSFCSYDPNTTVSPAFATARPYSGYSSMTLCLSSVFMLSTITASEYDISPSRTACLLDTFSCIAQGALPYGAQMLVAISAAREMGLTISAFEIIPLLFYPALLLICSLIAIFLPARKKG